MDESVSAPSKPGCAVPLTLSLCQPRPKAAESEKSQAKVRQGLVEDSEVCFRGFPEEAHCPVWSEH